MKKTTTLLLPCLFLFLFTFLSCGQKPEKLLLGGSGWNKIVIVDKESKAIEWEYPLEKGWECNSVAATPDGNILFSYSKGAKLITRDRKELWRIEAPEGCEMQTARVLPDGNYLLAWCGHPATILEVDKNGEIIHKTEFDTQIDNSHSQFRQVTKNDRGNYMVPLFKTSEVCEVTPAGSYVKKVKVGGNPFSIAPLSNGNWLVACGDAHCYIELNYETGEVVRKVDTNDIEGAPLSFVAQLLPIKSGGLYICNWQGHGGGFSPQLIETDRAGKMIWNLNDNDTFGMISAVCVFR